MVRAALLPPRLARLVTVALQARLHNDGYSPASVATSGRSSLGQINPLLPFPQHFPPVATQLGFSPFGDAFQEDAAPRKVATSYRKSKVKAKKARDPDQPKRPLSAWLRYLAVVRADQKGKMASKEIIPFAAGKWKALSPQEKKPFEDAYAAEKVEYDKVFAAYKAKKAADAKPKRPPTSYMLFTKEVRDENPGMPAPALAKKAGAAWKTLSDADKAKYKDMIVPLKAEYEKKLAAWEAKQAAKEAAGLGDDGER